MSLVIPHGSHNPYQSRYLYGDVVLFECDIGYYQEGALAVKCDATGSWNTSLPICKPKDCYAIVSLQHAAVKNYTNDTTYLSEAYIECDTGFNMTGASVLTCNATGQWMPERPQCNAISKNNWHYYIIVIKY